MSRSPSSDIDTPTELSSDGDIEMNRLDSDDAFNASHDELDNDLDEWSAEQALLGSDDHVHGHERSSQQAASTWAQVKDIVVETAPTLLFTTVGLLFTGELLDHVSRWKAMSRIDELIIIIPVILNLKGNLEMNLSARLGTAANTGQLDDRNTRYKILLGNMALLQVQATLVSFIASCLSFVLSFVVPRSPVSQSASSSPLLFVRNATGMLTSLTHPRRPRPPLPVDVGRPKSGITEFIMVASTAMSSACISSLLLGSFMCMLVLFCRRFKLNPDNIAPPVAACLGDLITLSLLGLVSTVLINFINTPLPFVLVVLLVLTACTCTYLTLRNNHVRDLIKQGWTPLFGAMFISSATGIVLDLFVSRYSGFALLAVVISGLPGAAGSVFVSRLSTTFHAAAGSSDNPGKGPAQPSARLVIATLFIVTLPIEVIFLTTLRAVGWLELPITFIASSLIFFCVAVVTSLFIARSLTTYLWSKGRDPDVYALPIHSSVVDLIGQLLLVVCFEIVSALGGKVQLKGQ